MLLPIRSFNFFKNDSIFREYSTKHVKIASQILNKKIPISVLCTGFAAASAAIILGLKYKKQINPNYGQDNVGINEQTSSDSSSVTLFNLFKLPIPKVEALKSIPKRPVSIG